MSPRRAPEAALLAVALSVTEGAGLLLLVPLLQLVGVADQRGSLASVTVVAERALSRVGLQATLGGVLAAYVVIIAIQSFVQRRQAVVTTEVEQEVVTTLRRQLHDVIFAMPWAEFVRHRSSEFVHALTVDVDRVGLGANLMIDLSAATLVAIIYLGLAVAVSPLASLLVTVCGLGFGLTLRPMFLAARRRGYAHIAASSAVYHIASEHLAGMKVAKSFSAERRQVERFEKATADLQTAAVSTSASYARFKQLLAVGSAALLAAIVYVARVVLHASTAELLLLIFLFARLIPRLTTIYERAQTVATLLPSFELVTDMIERHRAAAPPISVPGDGVPFIREVALEHVTVRYEDAASPAVRDVSFAIAAGSTTAIVGSSGAGKSTIADVLLGLIVPQAGHLRVDGQPLNVAQLATWREEIGYVPQESFLFNDTIRANLRWAKPDATDAAIRDALTQAAADTFVNELTHGLDTVVGDRGVLLSGGERQRIALARALLRRPKLLILDEATSALDGENEARILAAIDRLHHQMTIVIITHRLATIRGADEIHVLEQGELVESGSWDRLVANPAGRFARAFEVQRLDSGGTSGGVRRNSIEFERSLVQ